jgi:hypothetical protein
MNKPKTKSTAAVQEKIPYWVNETRSELSYVLVLTDERSDAVNDSLDIIDLTRAEFITLKRHLAELRGYFVPEEVAHA